MGYAIKLQGGVRKNIVLFFDAMTNLGNSPGTYNDDLLTFISGSWRSNVYATTNVTFTSKVSGFIYNAPAFGSGGIGITINGTAIAATGGIGPGSPLSMWTIHDRLYIKTGDTINIKIDPYYTDVLIVYSAG